MGVATACYGAQCSSRWSAQAAGWAKTRSLEVGDVMLPDNDFLHDLCHQNDCLYRCLSLCRAGMLTVTPLRTAHAGVLATQSPVWVQGVSMESACWFGHTEIRVKSRNQTLMTTKSMCTLQEMLSWLTEPSGCAVLLQFLEAVVVFPMPVFSQVSLVFHTLGAPAQ